MFGADPNWGRVLATVGARAGSRRTTPLDPAQAEVTYPGHPGLRTAARSRTTRRRSGRRMRAAAR